MTLIAATIIVAISLYGCGGDSVSQSATGGGNNCSSKDGSCSVASQYPISASDGVSGTSGTFGVSGTSSHVPAHCTAAPAALPGCSHQSYLDCTCYDPNNDQQSG